MYWLKQLKGKIKEGGIRERKGKERGEGWNKGGRIKIEEGGKKGKERGEGWNKGGRIKREEGGKEGEKRGEKGGRKGEEKKKGELGMEGFLKFSYL